MNRFIRRLQLLNNIKSQYHCLGSISNGHIVCPNCNLQVPVEIEIEENEAPVTNKIERETVDSSEYPDMRGHVDRY